MISKKKFDQIAKLFYSDSIIQKVYKTVSLTPFLISENEYISIKKATEKISKIVEKTIALYCRDPEIKKFLSFSKLQEHVFDNSGNKFQRELHFARFDGILSSKRKFKFIELNTGFPGSIVRIDRVNKNIFSVLNDQQLCNKTKIIDRFVKIAKKIYQLCGSKDLFLVGHGSFMSEKKIMAIGEIVNVLAKNKIPVCSASWCEIKTKNNNLFFHDKKISVIYRAEVTSRIWKNDFQDFKPILDSIKCNKTFLYNSLRAYISGTKEVFALWHSAIFQKYLTKIEKQAIQKYIPITFKLDQKSALKVLANKNKYLLKPIFGFGGENIVIGRITDERNWQVTIKNNLKNNQYVCQEYIQPMEKSIDILDLERRILNNKKMNVNINPWYGDGRMIGITGRFSESKIINISRGGGYIPVFIKG